MKRRTQRVPRQVRESRPAYQRAPQSIRLDNLSVCEMLHDNPNRRVGQAPRLASSPLASRQISPSALDEKVQVVQIKEKVKGSRKSWVFGKRMARVAA